MKVKDIAKMLGLSPATVSLVLNNKPGISEKTRNRVLKAVQEMGYDTRALVKPALKNNRNIRFIIYKKHGKVVSDTAFFSALTEGIETQARKEGYNLVVSYLNEKDSSSEVIRVIRDNPLEGILILATEMEKKDLKHFKSIKAPILVLDSYFEDERLNTVVINNVQGAFKGTEYLIEKGHKKIGYLHSSVWINNFDERTEGVKKALSKHGMKLEDKYIFSVESTLDGAYRDMSKLLSSNPTLPTAFFADNDIIASGAIKALKEKGLRIPWDISIVGFDDMPFCEILDPPMTTVRVYKQAMGVLAVKCLCSMINEKTEQYVKIEVGTDLAERDSVLDLNKMSDNLSKTAGS